MTPRRRTHAAVATAARDCVINDEDEGRGGKDADKAVAVLVFRSCRAARRAGSLGALRARARARPSVRRTRRLSRQRWRPSAQTACVAPVVDAMHSVLARRKLSCADAADAAGMILLSLSPLRCSHFSLLPSPPITMSHLGPLHSRTDTALLSENAAPGAQDSADPALRSVRVCLM